jgi:drug/metabolite transporter (DMT)-like permease
LLGRNEIYLVQLIKAFTLNHLHNFSSPNFKAILLALFVTFLWSTSFIIIKWGLIEIPPLTFAGLRYFIAFVCLLPFIFKKQNIDEFKKLDLQISLKLLWLGILFYFFTQGAQFLGLYFLPAVTVSLLLNLTPIIVAVLAIFLISETPNFLQWMGMLLFICGILVYFYPVLFSENQIMGLIIMIFGVLSNALSAVLGRDINRSGNVSPYIVTLVSMGLGSVMLMSTGIIIEGLSLPDLKGVMYILWLAVINTAFAFTIWNFTLRSLTAMESSIINGTMLIQIAVLAYMFLGEEINLKEVIGLVLAGFGAILVQLKLKPKTKIIPD